MDKKTKQAFKLAFDHLKGQLQPAIINDDQIRTGSSVLIFGTGPESALIHIIKTIKKLNENASIHIIVRPFLETPMRLICNERDTVHIYEDTGSFQLDQVKQLLNKTELSTPESTIVALNNTWGMGYENVFEILAYLKPKMSFAYNAEGRWLDLHASSIKKRIAALKLCTAMANWHWEENYSSIDE